MDPAELIGVVLENRYRILELIGSGGMGSVYRARHIHLDELCAVKVLSPRFALDREWINRFLLEARAALRIRHDNVVQIRDFGYPRPGFVYIVMESISGENLSDLLKRDGPIAWERALRMAGHVAAGLEAAHSQGIIHRDIKPSNCFRTTLCGDPDFIKVLDFGIAKFTDSNDDAAYAPRTATGIWMGTAEYMAPETFRGAPPDARVDVYAVGVLMYKLITGEAPFQGNHIEVAIELTQRDAVPPSQIAPARNIPPRIDALIMRALARDRAARTSGMAELRAELAAALEGDSIIVDIDDVEPTMIRKVILPATYTPTTPPFSPAPATGPTPPPSGSEQTSAPSSSMSARAIAPSNASTSTGSQRAVASQTEPHPQLSTQSALTPTTEVSSPQQRERPIALIAASLIGLTTLSLSLWWLASTPSSVDVRPVPTSTASAPPVARPAAPRAPAPGRPPPPPAREMEPAEAVLSAPEEPDVVEQPQLLRDEAPVSRPRPHPGPRKKVAPEPIVEPPPEQLSRSEVTRSFDAIQRACATSFGVRPGNSALIDVTISSEGSASASKIKSDNDVFFDCIRSKLRSARFGSSSDGGKFRHSFVAG